MGPIVDPLKNHEIFQNFCLNFQSFNQDYTTITLFISISVTFNNRNLSLLCQAYITDKEFETGKSFNYRHSPKLVFRLILRSRRDVLSWFFAKSDSKSFQAFIGSVDRREREKKRWKFMLEKKHFTIVNRRCSARRRIFSRSESSRRASRNCDVECIVVKITKRNFFFRNCENKCLRHFACSFVCHRRRFSLAAVFSKPKR